MNIFTFHPIRIISALKRRITLQFQVIQSIISPSVPGKIQLELFDEFDTRKTDSLKSVVLNLKKSFFIRWSEKELYLSEYSQKFSIKYNHRVISEADDIAEQKLNILGSGIKKVHSPLKWNMDIATGQKWPMYKSGQVPIFFNNNSDIMRVWELSRFQWGPILGQAYWMTGDEKYANKFIGQILHWCRKNPYGYGPNWISSQDVALRAVNWIITLCFLGGDNAISSEIWTKISTALFLHGLHLEKHLDLNYMGNIKTTGTHYLSNLLGLLYLGLIFRTTSKGQEWIDFSTKEFFSEITYQVDEEGADYESSVACYHKFALEHFMFAYILFRLNDIEVPDYFLVRLEKMFEFVRAYTRPDGSVPQIGDNGDGRVHIFSRFNSCKKDDHRYLISIGNFLFQNEQSKKKYDLAEEESFWPLLLLRIRENYTSQKSGEPIDNSEFSKGFRESGFYFMRKDDSFMAISANPVGMKGKGNHKHNDIFSIDLFYKETAFIVDPGSYAYTTNLNERQLFRSTAYHNVIQLNNYEQNEIDPSKPWRVKEFAKPTVLDWQVNKNYDLFIGEHYGYSRFLPGLKVRRKILFDKIYSAWWIQDVLSDMPETKEKIDISIFFHLNSLPVKRINNQGSIPLPQHPGIKNFFSENNAIKVKNSVEVIGADHSIIIHADGKNEQELFIEDGWISREYGVKIPAPVLRYKSLYNGKNQFTFIIKPKLN